MSSLPIRDHAPGLRSQPQDYCFSGRTTRISPRRCSLLHLQVVELHEFQHREEGDDHLAAAAHIGEKGFNFTSADGDDLQQALILPLTV